MCYDVSTYLPGSSIKKLGKKYDVDISQYIPFFHASAFSLPQLGIITTEGKMIRSTWGLIPEWVNDYDKAAELRMKTFNARSETLDKKPSFKEAFQSQRCLIPVGRYFEWQHRHNQKVPWSISLKHEDFLLFGGLYNEWIDHSTGESEHTFTIVTTEANPFTADIHNSKKRMPLILAQHSQEIWLSSNSTLADLSSIMKPFPEDQMEAYTVNPLISNRKANRDRIEILSPHNYDTLSLF